MRSDALVMRRASQEPLNNVRCNEKFAICVDFLGPFCRKATGTAYGLRCSAEQGAAPRGLGQRPAASPENRKPPAPACQGLGSGRDDSGGCYLVMSLRAFSVHRRLVERCLGYSVW